MKKKPFHNRGKALTYRISQWDEYQWRSFVSQSPQVQTILQKGAERLYSFPDFVQEVFHRLYSHEPIPLEQTKPEHQWAEQAHLQLSELPDFAQLTQRCRGDRFLSGVAATAFAEKMLEAFPEQSSSLEDPQRLRAQVKSLKTTQKQVLQQGASLPQEAQELLDELIKQGKSQIRLAQQFARDLESSSMRQNFRRACDHAQNHMDRTVEQLEALGFEHQTGSQGIGGELATKTALAQRIGESKKLKAIAREAGRLKRIAAHKQRSRSNVARSEVNNIGCGAELARLLPLELVTLGEPSLFGLFARGLVERSLLVYELTGKEHLGRGPLVVCLDSSGSMAGKREIWSKAVALALLSIATRQKRTCRILHFTNQVERVDDFPPGKIDEQRLLDSMEAFFDGGTDFEAPLQEAWRAIRRERELQKADIIMITDGECEVTPEFRRLWQEARAPLSLTVYGVLLDVRHLSSFQEVCDVILPLPSLSEDLQVVDTLFSI